MLPPLPRAYNGMPPFPMSGAGMPPLPQPIQPTIKHNIFTPLKGFLGSGPWAKAKPQ